MSMLIQQALMMAGTSVPTANYLDELATLPKVVLSLRKLVSTATNAIRVRRSSDSTEMDIGFVGKDLDTATLLTFAGAGSAFIKVIYDQTGNGWNANQTTTASQPRIVNAGLVDTAMIFDGTDDGMFITNLTNGTQYLALYNKVAYRNVSYSGNPLFYEMGSDFTGAAGRVASYGAPESGANQTVQCNATTGVRRCVYNFSWSSLDKISILYDTSKTTDQILVYENGSFLTPIVGAAGGSGGTFSTQNFNIGRRNNASLSSQISLFTMVLYNADTTAIRASIEAVLN